MFPDLVESVSRDDGGGRVGNHGRIEDVGGGQGLKVGGVGADGGDGAFIDDRLDLDDEGVEGVDMERVDRA